MVLQTMDLDEPSFAQGIEEVISGLSSEVVELTKQACTISLWNAGGSSRR